MKNPFLVPGRTLLVLRKTLSTEGSTWNPKGFSYGQPKPKSVELNWGQSDQRMPQGMNETYTCITQAALA